MKQENEIPYSETLAHNFKEIETKDNVFYNQNGYQYRVVYKNLYKGVRMDWDIETRTAELILHKKEKILSRLPIRDIEHFNELIEFFKPK